MSSRDARLIQSKPTDNAALFGRHGNCHVIRMSLKGSGSVVMP